MSDGSAGDPEVLVVGFGPVGAAVALFCTHRGLSVRAVDRAVEIYDLPRAIGMDDEVQRAFALHGLGDGLARVTSPMRGAEFVDVGGSRIMGIDLPEGFVTPLGRAPLVAYYQPELEAFLRGAAVDAGVEVLLGREVRGVGQDATSAWAEVADPDGVGGSTIHSARWVVACDGAGSPVRKQLGVAFEDQGFDQDWLVVDLRLRHPEALDPLPVLAQQICDPARPVTFVPGHGPYRRWEFQLQPGETRDEMAEADRVWELVAPWVDETEAELVRAVVYRFHATVAARMRVGRVFLAGDAAHQMPPFLGQGLCAGVRDAANLAWKLTAAARRSGTDAILDTYDAERRPHATAVVDHAVATGKLIDALAARGGGIDTAAGYGGDRPFPTLEHGLLLDDHPLTGTQMPQPPGPAGAELEAALGTGPVLVGAADPLAEATADTRRRWDEVEGSVVTAPGWRGPGGALASAAAVLVRPDGYVAAVAAAGEVSTRVAAFSDCLSGTVPPLR